MKILLEGEIFSRQEFGGISRYFAEISRGFIQRGHSVSSICPLRVNRYIETVQNIKHIGCRAPSIPKTNRLRSSISSCIAKLIPIQSGDVFHETYYRNVRRTQDIPVVTTVYDMIYEKSGESFSDLEYMLKAKRRSLENADKIICISEWTKKDLLDVYPQFECKTSVIHLGNARFATQTAPNHHVAKCRYILYVGLRKGYKNFATLVAAFRQVLMQQSDLVLVIFGGPPLSQQELALFAAFFILPTQFSYIRGDDSNLAWLYRNAQAFIYPSTSEGFGIPLLEAMSQGCPVICSKASCFPEVCGDAAIYFDPLSAEDLSDKILLLLGCGQAERADQIKQGLAQSEKFTWDNCIEKTLSVYHSLL